MRILTKIRVHDAVYWAPGTLNDQGRPSYDQGPVALKVRWEDDSVEYLDREDRKQVSKAIVFVGNQDALDHGLVVNGLGVLDGVFWKGKLVDLVDASHPFSNPGAWTVQRVRVIPVIKGDDALVQAIL